MAGMSDSVARRRVTLAAILEFVGEVCKFGG